MDKQKIIDKWISRNGACTFDLKNKDIILHDGGLFSIDPKKVKRPKITGYKKLKEGGSQVLFSKRKYTETDYEATFWFEDLDETINYLKRMKRMLNKLGYRTKRKFRKGKTY